MAGSRTGSHSEESTGSALRGSSPTHGATGGPVGLDFLKVAKLAAEPHPAVFERVLVQAVHGQHVVAAFLRHRQLPPFTPPLQEGETMRAVTRIESSFGEVIERNG